MVKILRLLAVLPLLSAASFPQHNPSIDIGSIKVAGQARQYNIIIPGGVLYFNPDQVESRIIHEEDNIPIPAPHVVKRHKPLEKLHTFFFEKLSEFESPIVAIIGNSAEGKTELAKQYAKEFKDKYNHRWFVQVENWEAEYRNLAKSWQLFRDTDTLDIDVIVHGVHRVFSQSPEVSLIIFDNAPEGFVFEKLKMQLPSKTHFLVTSKDLDWENRLLLSQEDCHLTTEEGIEILREWIDEKRFDPIEAKVIVDRFSHLPVVIANAGSFIDMTPVILMKDYLPIFETNKKEVLKEGKHSDQSSDIVASLMTILKQLDPLTLDLLNYCTFLPGKNIPIPLLLSLVEINQLQLLHHLKAMGTLVVCDIGHVTIHDLFQDILVGEIAQKKKEHYLAKLATISDKFENFLLTNRNKAIVIYEEGFNEAERQGFYQEAIEFLLKLGNVYEYFGQYSQSLQFNQKALAKCQASFGEDHPITAKSYNSMGRSLSGLDRHHEALHDKRKALEIRKRVLYENHPDTAESYDDVGQSLDDLGMPEQALICSQQALTIRRNIFGESSYTTARSYNNVGIILYSLGLYEDAIVYEKQALEIFKNVFGHHHPMTGRGYGNIGTSFEALDQHQKALEYHLIALEIFRETYGENHPSTAKSYNNLGLILGNLGRYDEALKYALQGLEIRKKVFGENHSETARSHDIVGTTLGKLGRYEESLWYLHQARAIFETTFGENHPNSLQIYNEIGITLRLQGMLENALMYARKAFISSCSYFKERHPEQELYLKELIAVMNQLSDTDLCNSVKEEILPLAVEKFGTSDPLIQALQRTCKN